MARELHDAALGREVPAQDREPARGLERRLDRDDDLLALPLDGGRRDLAERAPVDVRRVVVDEPHFRELARDERDAAGLVHVGGDEAAARLQARDDGRPLGDPLEVLELEGDLELAGDREQVEDAVRRAAGGRDRGGRVLERLARDDLRGADVLPHEVHREPPHLLGRLVLRRVERRDPVEAARADAEELERRGHRVRGELAAAGACARARDALELVQVGRVDRPGRVRADRLEDVQDRHVPAPGTGRARSSRCRGRARAGRAGRAP